MSDALTKAFLGYYQGLLRTIRKLVDNPVDLEDIVHEAYLRSLEASKTQRINYPKAFIARTARNLAINHLASASLRNHESYADGEYRPGETDKTSLEDQVEAERRFVEFCQAVEQLPAKCRRVFTLKQVYGLSQKEIAKQLEISEKTVEYHVSKGLLHCHRYMKRLESRDTKDSSAETAIVSRQGMMR